MKTFIVLCIGFLTSMPSLDQKIADQYVVYYFGATDCGYCNMPENIENIKKIKSEFKDKYNERNVKFVMVCFDNDIDEGLEFVKKYGFWDEISIGQRYYNELSLQYLNKTKLPGLPHVAVYHDTYENIEEWSVPVIKERKTMADLVGGTEIDQWINDGYPLSN